MPPLSPRLYLTDMLDAGERVARLTDGKSLGDYEADDHMRLIVERSFEIVGEAMRQLLAADQGWEAKFTNARKIIQFRNFLIHAYHLVDQSIV